jgi:aldehyde:ferredoxin oxidoreductase
MLNEYYELRRWDKKTGWPTREKLEELDLKDVADSLEKLNRLPKSSNSK